MRIVVAFLCFALVAVSVIADEERGALVTAREGPVFRVIGGEKKPLEAFERVTAGEVLALDNARVTLVFFLTAREETYRGSGRLEINPGEGRPWGLAPPEVKKLPDFLVKQIAKTPTLVAQGRAGVTRLRAIATADALARVEETYRRLRLEAAANDLNPEMYRLSALFELRAYDAVESALRDLELSRPRNEEAKVLIALYRKALKNAPRGE